MYIVEVDMPNLAKGSTVEIDGLGLFPNGEARPVSADEAAAYRARHVRQETTTDEEGRMIQILVEAPTLLMAFKKVEGVNVRTMSKEERDMFYEDDAPSQPDPQDKQEDQPSETSEGDDH